MAIFTRVQPAISFAVLDVVVSGFQICIYYVNRKTRNGSFCCWKVGFVADARNCFGLVFFSCLVPFFRSLI